MTADTSNNRKQLTSQRLLTTGRCQRGPYLGWHRLDSGECEWLHRGTLGSRARGLNQHPLQQTMGQSDLLEISTVEDPLRTMARCPTTTGTHGKSGTGRHTSHTHMDHTKHPFGNMKFRPKSWGRSWIFPAGDPVLTLSLTDQSSSLAVRPDVGA